MRKISILSVLVLQAGFGKYLLKARRFRELADGSDSGGYGIIGPNEYWRRKLMDIYQYGRILSVFICFALSAAVFAEENARRLFGETPVQKSERLSW